jgi:hypothetical protein
VDSYTELKGQKIVIMTKNINDIGELHNTQNLHGKGADIK